MLGRVDLKAGERTIPILFDSRALFEIESVHGWSYFSEGERSIGEAVQRPTGLVPILLIGMERARQRGLVSSAEPVKLEDVHQVLDEVPFSTAKAAVDRALYVRLTGQEPPSSDPRAPREAAPTTEGS